MAGGRRLVRWASAVVVALVIGLVVVAWLADRFAPETAGPVAIADVSSERLLALGSVVGLAAAHDTHAWLGLPYAQPPVDALRWRAPRAPNAWVDTFDALAFGPPCVQLPSRLGGVATAGPDGVVGEEDCLRLNVWAPRLEPDAIPSGRERLPVLVFLHGGGNRWGHAGLSMYDGARLAGRERAVVVTFNYRLGPFGWLSHPALRREADDPLEASGNFALLDQVAALRWVARHIGEFGGDPNDVTIFGESAGASDVLALLLAEPARGLFHRAIAQSGSTDSVGRVEAEAPFDPEAGEGSGLRKSSAETVVSRSSDPGRAGSRGGAALRRGAARRGPAKLPARSIAERGAGRVSRSRLPRSPRRTDPDPGRRAPARRRLARGRGRRPLPSCPRRAGQQPRRIEALPVPGSRARPAHVRPLLPDPRPRRLRAPRAPSQRSLGHSRRSRTRAGDARGGHREVYAYRFDWDEMPKLLGVGVELSQLLGAAHGFELPFLFGTFELGDPLVDRMVFREETRASRELLSQRMMDYWGEFARAGRPGRGGAADGVAWPAWAAEEGRAGALLVFDAEADGGIRVDRSQLSIDRVIAAVEAEPGLDRREKCALVRDLFARTGARGSIPVGADGQPSPDERGDPSLSARRPGRVGSHHELDPRRIGRLLDSPAHCTPRAGWIPLPRTMPASSTGSSASSRRVARRGRRVATRRVPARRGIASIGAKVEEEAAEVIAAARDESDAAVAHEAADLLFHLWVLMVSRGVEPSRVYAELAWRFGVGGLAEKAARGGQAGGGGR
ncbi:MAG: phosphoribosyl-ATP diphosphatase [Myxococcota bacterium]